MRDIFLALAFIGIILFGYYLAGRLGRSLKKHYKSRRRPAEGYQSGVMIFSDRPGCWEEAESGPGLPEAERQEDCFRCRLSSCLNHR